MPVHSAERYVAPSTGCDGSACSITVRERAVESQRIREREAVPPSPFFLSPIGRSAERKMSPDGDRQPAKDRDSARPSSDMTKRKVPNSYVL